jgi:hypothetical protein
MARAPCKIAADLTRHQAFAPMLSCKDMNCSACGKRTIGFLRWAAGLDGYLWTRPYCHAALRCSRSVKRWALVIWTTFLVWMVHAVI